MNAKKPLLQSLIASRAAFAIPIILLSVMLIGQTVSADQLDLHGISIPVEELAEVDDKHVKVRLFGSTQLLEKENLGQYVLQAYLNKPGGGSEIGTERWKSLFEAALKGNDAKTASQAFLLYGLSQQDKKGLDSEFLEAVFLDQNSPKGLARAVVSSNHFQKLEADARKPILLALGVSDIKYLLSNALSGVLSMGDTFRVYAEDKFAENLILENLDLARKIAYLLESLYIGRSEQYRKFNLALNLISELQNSEKNAGNTNFVTLVSLRNTDETLRPILDPFLIASFHKTAAELLQNSKPEEALIALSGINSEQSTPTTMDLLDRIIPALDPSSRVFLNDSVMLTMRSAAAKNEALFAKVDELFFTRVKKLLELRSFSDAKKALATYAEMSTDSDRVDELRLEFALALLRAGNLQEAERFLRERNTPLSLGGKFKLFLDGYYGSPFLYVLIFLVPLTLKLAYEFLKKGGAVVDEPNARTSHTAQTDHTEEPLESFRAHQAEADQGGSGIGNFMSMRKQRDPLYEEYLECLRVFELQKGADMKQIKTNYRNAVRKIHPDLNPNQQSPDDASRFVELTKAYDRLRELHKLLGIPD